MLTYVFNASLQCKPSGRLCPSRPGVNPANRCAKPVPMVVLVPLLAYWRGKGAPFACCPAYLFMSTGEDRVDASWSVSTTYC